MPLRSSDASTAYANTLRVPPRSVLIGFDPTRFVWKKIMSRLAIGRLIVETPSGERMDHHGSQPGPEAVLSLKRWRALQRLAFQGDVGFAESYLDGDWTSPNISALIELAALNYDTLQGTISAPLIARLVNRLYHRRRANTKRGSRRNIAAHYDLGNDFYRRWLDRDMTYSSALFTAPDQSLEQAQDNKIGRLTELLDIQGGERVLEIGSGWGALAERIARQGGHVTGLTLSSEQLVHARQRLAGAGLAERAEFRLQDYREVRGSFDRIVSVEMIEAVGLEYWPTYFATIRDRLAPHGTAVLQVITIDDKRFKTYKNDVDFIQRYIFPGGMLPSPQTMREETARAGLELVSVEEFGQSYARTLAEWQHRFQAEWPAVEGLGFTTEFKRMWEYYLSYCEGAFRAGAINVGIYRLIHGGRRP